MILIVKSCVNFLPGKLYIAFLTVFHLYAIGIFAIPSQIICSPSGKFQPAIGFIIWRARFFSSAAWSWCGLNLRANWFNTEFSRKNYWNKWNEIQYGYLDFSKSTFFNPIQIIQTFPLSSSKWIKPYYSWYDSTFWWIPFSYTR